MAQWPKAKTPKNPRKKTGKATTLKEGPRKQRLQKHRLQSWAANRGLQKVARLPTQAAGIRALQTESNTATMQINCRQNTNASAVKASESCLQLQSENAMKPTFKRGWRERFEPILKVLDYGGFASDDVAFFSYPGPPKPTDRPERSLCPQASNGRFSHFDAATCLLSPGVC